MAGRTPDSVYHAAGWVLFLLCAVLFLIAAARDGDGLLALASLLFLGGCVLFLVPILFPGTGEGKGSKPDARDHPVDER